MDDQKTRYEACQGDGKKNPVLSDIARDLRPDSEIKADIAKALDARDLVWHKRFINMAALVSTWSKDPSTKCGAVIVDRKQRVVSTGYNGLPRGIEDHTERLICRETKYNLTVHSEVNALMFANIKLNGCTIYSYPLPPCVRCAVQIIQSGITTVVANKMTPYVAERWGESVEISKTLFEEAGVRYLEI